MLAISAVASFVILAGAIVEWFGWLPNTNDDEVFFNGFHFWLLALELIAVVAAAVALRRFRFPLLVIVLAAAIWSFVSDLLSNGGGWAAIVSIAVGLAFLFAGIAVDGGPSRFYGFWLHVAAGLAIGGGLLWFFHDGDFDWIVVAVIGLLYIALGRRPGPLELGRSSGVGHAPNCQPLRRQMVELQRLLPLPALPVRHASRVRRRIRCGRTRVGGAGHVRGHRPRVHRDRDLPRGDAPGRRLVEI